MKELNEILKNFVKENKYNYFLLNEIYKDDLNDESKINDIIEELKNSEINFKNRVISKNLSIAQDVIAKSTELNDKTKLNLLKSLDNKHFICFVNPIEIDSLDFLLQFILNDCLEYYNYYSLENDEITPVIILNKEINYSANEIKHLFDNKEESFPNLIKSFKKKLKDITSKTLTIQKKYALSVDDSEAIKLVLEPLREEIRNCIDYLEDLINKQNNSVSVDSNKLTREPLQYDNQEIINLLNSNFEIIKQLINEEKNIKYEQIEYSQSVNNYVCSTLNIINEKVSNSKIVNFGNSKKTYVPEVIDIDDTYKLIKVK